MKKSMLMSAVALAAMVIAGAASAKDLSGAGSTAIYPVLAKWADAYHTANGIAVNYQAIGSGGGIQQINAKTVDFGASDKPLKHEDLVKNSEVQFPAVIIAIVPVVNVPGIKPGDLVLSGELLADIYLGKVAYWDDAAIKKLNPSLKLPHLDISTVHRSDGSGTTFNFTDYLGKVSPDWKQKVGADTAVEWPNGVGGKGNAGVASMAQQINGAQSATSNMPTPWKTRWSTRKWSTRPARHSRQARRRSSPAARMPISARPMTSTRFRPTRPARTAGRSPR